ncbi:TPA: hypothetical protein ACIX5H_004617, partial [Escherichia coli]
MNRSESPKKQPKPFGVNGQRVAILPTTPAGDNSASYEQGFPPITMILKSAGGLPPKGQDMNQILYELSALGRWSSTGALNTFDSEFASEISGYPSGAMLISDDGERIFINTTEGNLSDPNSNGTGWKDILSYLSLVDGSGVVGRLLNTQVITSSGTYTPTPGTRKIKAILTGGGGGGSSVIATSFSQTAFGGGGGSAATCIGIFDLEDISNFSVVIGAGGTADNPGGTSTFNGMSAGRGGSGSGVNTPSLGSGGAAGTATGGLINIHGSYGSDGQQGSYYSFGNGAASFWGGGGRAGSNNGVAARAYGAGGGAAYDTSFSGVLKAGG